MREPTETERAVAGALAECDGFEPDIGMIKIYMRRARKAIRAMRHMTQELRTALFKEGLDQSGFDETLWPTLIDAASPEDLT